MKLAMYYPWIYLRSGIERTILEIYKKSNHDWTIFTNHYNQNQTFKEFENVKVVELSYIPVNRSYISVLFAGLKIALENLNLSNYDGLLVHNEGLGNLITFNINLPPTVCYCYTPLKILHDPTLKYSYLKSNFLKIPFFYTAAFIFNFIDRRTWQKYDNILCCSSEIKKRILKTKLAAPHKTKILYLGVDTKKWKSNNVSKKYFLLPSRIKWWKNIELSIKAFRKFLQISPDSKMELVIAGQLIKSSEKYLKKLKNIAKGLPVKFITNPTIKEFQHLIQNCHAVLNTTLNEDGGITILEAMASGKPVIAVDKGGPKDIIKNRKNGFLTKPCPNEFAKIMMELGENKKLTNKIAKKSRESILKYDWKSFVEKIDFLMEKICQ